MKNRSIVFLMALSAILLGYSCSNDEVAPPEILPSDGTSLTLQGGEGEGDAKNAVYVDLSAERQISISRDSWDLGFYSGSENRVILNNQTGMAAIKTQERSLKDVNSSSFDINQFKGSYSPAEMKLYDDTAGRLSHTVVGDISNSPDNANVFVVHTALRPTIEKENIWKFVVTINADQSYAIEYGRIDDTQYQKAIVKKNAVYNFAFFSFSKGIVEVEPKKEDWDIVWTKAMASTAMGSVHIPYIFSDLVLINNLGGVSAQQIVTKDLSGVATGLPSYEEFSESHLAQLKLANRRNVIAANWRATVGNNAGVYKERYYIIKDGVGNIYKLRFLSMGAGSDGGKRGYPELEFKLLKRG